MAEVVRLLLDVGADGNLRDKHVKTAAMLLLMMATLTLGIRCL